MTEDMRTPPPPPQIPGSPLEDALSVPIKVCHYVS